MYADGTREEAMHGKWKINSSRITDAEMSAPHFGIEMGMERIVQKPQGRHGDGLLFAREKMMKGGFWPDEQKRSARAPFFTVFMGFIPAGWTGLQTQ